MEYYRRAAVSKRICVSRVTARLLAFYLPLVGFCGLGRICGRGSTITSVMPLHCELNSDAGVDVGASKVLTKASIAWLSARKVTGRFSVCELLLPESLASFAEHMTGQHDTAVLLHAG